jgi:dTDP-L-rhamnose 4-epimerase
MTWCAVGRNSGWVVGSAGRGTGGRLIAGPHAGDQGQRASEIRLCDRQVRAGAADAHADGASTEWAAAALRLWNAYGPGQALSNPYTGVLAIFASRIANGEAPMSLRGRPAAPRFRTCPRRGPRLSPGARSNRSANGQVFNIGSGQDRYRRGRRAPPGRGHESARIFEPEIAGKARAGDIRHCIPGPDARRARVLGYRGSARTSADGTLRTGRVGRAAGGGGSRRRGAHRELEMRGLVA